MRHLMGDIPLFLGRRFEWLSLSDSNGEHGDQSPVSCHYSKGQPGWADGIRTRISRIKGALQDHFATAQLRWYTAGDSDPEPVD